MVKLSITVEVNPDYDDPEAFEDELQQALDNEENVSVHVAGEHFDVMIKGVHREHEL